MYLAQPAVWGCLSSACSFSAPNNIDCAISDLQANLQRQAVVFNALLAERLPHAVTLAAALVTDSCPGEPPAHHCCPCPVIPAADLVALPLRLLHCTAA